LLVEKEINLEQEITTEINRYHRNQCVVFRKTKDAFGGLSNMCAGFEIELGDYSFLTSEALYQAFRFNDEEIQRTIMNEKSPMAAKMKSKKYRANTRPDWDEVRVDIMEWCLLMKLKCNWENFSTLLLVTECRDIVEESHKDRFWGTVEDESGLLVGSNVLGKLLMKIREALKQGRPSSSQEIRFKEIRDLVLFGEDVNFLVHAIL
jgi:type I restriction enzyme S subunit